jgi:hypothetical protein
MKSVIAILATALLILSPVPFVQAQTPTPAAAGKTGAAAPAGAGKRTDVYHVHFAKATLGKAAQLGDWLKTPDPKAPMATPGIMLSLRISAQKRPWKLPALPCPQTSATSVSGITILL